MTHWMWYVLYRNTTQGKRWGMCRRAEVTVFKDIQVSIPHVFWPSNLHTGEGSLTMSSCPWNSPPLSRALLLSRRWNGLLNVQLWYQLRDHTLWGQGVILRYAVRRCKPGVEGVVFSCVLRLIIHLRNSCFHPHNPMFTRFWDPVTYYSRE